MINIILYSDNNKNIKKVQDLLENRKDLRLILGKYKGAPVDDFDPSAIDLMLFDLPSFFKDDSFIKTSLKNINDLFNKSKARRMLLLESGKKEDLFEDHLSANDFIFIKNMEQELLVRIDFILHKMNLVVLADSLVFGNMILNMRKYELVAKGKLIVLTFKEFEMLKLLMQNKDQVFTRIDILSSVWGYDYYGGSRTVDVHMRRLRAKIPPPYNNMLKTIRNVGYMFSPEK